GNCPVSAFAYGAYGLMLCGPLNDIDTGYQFGQLATTLLTKLDATAIHCRTMVVVSNFVNAWRWSFRDLVAPMIENYQTGLETGDTEYASYSICFAGFYAFASGKNLVLVEQDMASYQEVMTNLKQTSVAAIQRCMRQATTKLLGEETNPHQLSGRIYDEAQELSSHLAANDHTLLFWTHYYRVVLGYLFDQYDQALEDMAACKKYVEGVTGFGVNSLLVWYDSLIYLARYPDQDSRTQKQSLKIVRANQKRLKYWAEQAPENHQHRYHLVEAERARVLGQEGDARIQYDQAIQLAELAGFVQDVALANELAARFYQSCHQPKLVAVYIRDAQDAYQKWGAQAKVDHLQLEFPEILYQPEPTQAITTTTTTLITTSQYGSTGLDLDSIQRASQAVSGEIALDKLLTKLMKMTLENAGAERGLLILNKLILPADERHWVVEAEGHVDQAEITVLQGTPLSDVETVAQSVINYVIRTQSSVVLDDAMGDEQFRQDPHIVQQGVKSTLCLPLRHQNRLTGLLYLENNLTVGAFTKDRIETLDLLMSQVAISVEHAQLYAELEDRVKMRTVELSTINERLTAEIGERKRMEDSLGTSEARYRRMFEDSPISLWEEDYSDLKTHLDSLRAEGVVDLKAYFKKNPEAVAYCASLMKVLDVNKATARLFEAQDKQDVLGNLSQILGAGTFDETFQDELIAIANGEPSFTAQVVNYTLTGKQIYADVSVSVAPGSEETYDKAMVSLIDVTAQKLAEDALKQQNEYLAALHDMTLGVISRFDLDDLLEALVERAAQLLDTPYGFIYLAERDADEAELKTIVGLSVGQMGATAKRGEGLAGQIWEAGEPLIVADYQTWDGHLSDLEDNLLGAVAGVPLTQNPDVTQDQRGEPQVVGVIGLAHNKDMNRQFGSEEVTMLNRFAQLASIALDNARLYTDVQDARVAAETLNQELGQALTDLKSTQSQLVEAEKMAALGALVSGVAHEINTPVGIGVTAASLLEEKTASFHGIYQGGQMRRSDLQNYLETASQSSAMILSNLKRAAELIQSFKLVAVDQSTEDLRLFPVRAYMEDVLLSLRPRLKKTKIQVEISGSEAITLNSYPGVFAQIMTNFVMNSLVHAYAADDEGILRFCFSQTDEDFIFEYEDDGRGISPEHLGRIFEPFFTTKRADGGTGLGLNIIYNLVTQKLGGHIQCESDLGQGTRFTITVPLNDALVKPG
ncbi:MAG: GAF domain-containing protein, partial [Chloroflexota bacterium]